MGACRGSRLQISNHIPLDSRLPYDARSASRKRRSVNDTMGGSSSNGSSTTAVQPEMLTMYRAIEVFLPKD